MAGFSLTTGNVNFITVNNNLGFLGNYLRFGIDSVIVDVNDGSKLIGDLFFGELNADKCDDKYVSDYKGRGRVYEPNENGDKFDLHVKLYTKDQSGKRVYTGEETVFRSVSNGSRKCSNGKYTIFFDGRPAEYHYNNDVYDNAFAERWKAIKKALRKDKKFEELVTKFAAEKGDYNFNEDEKKLIEPYATFCKDQLEFREGLAEYSSKFNEMYYDSDMIDFMSVVKECLRELSTGKNQHKKNWRRYWLAAHAINLADDIQYDE